MKIENIQDKFKKIELEMTKIEKTIVQKYNAEFKELLQQKNEEKKRQLKLLKFFKAIGFDIISK
ncbi:hypothetical protein [Sulfurimonas sp.]|uniref:hypothetical protein n=1 Tax=Sulfurimonas sp. TaxID=2022749 RepID=UPI003D0C4468